MATIIDDNYQPNSASIWPTAMKYGLFIALVSIVLQVAGNLFGLDAMNPEAGFAAKAFGYLGTIVGIVLLVQAVKYVRDELQGGRITFGKAFGTGMATAVISLLIGAVWTYIYFSFIDTDGLEALKEATMQNAQIDEDQEGSEMAISMMESMFSPAAIAGWAILGGSILYAIINLIIAAVMKKD